MTSIKKNMQVFEFKHFSKILRKNLKESNRKFNKFNLKI